MAEEAREGAGRRVAFGGVSPRQRRSLWTRPRPVTKSRSLPVDCTPHSDSLCTQGIVPSNPALPVEVRHPLPALSLSPPVFGSPAHPSHPRLSPGLNSSQRTLTAKCPRHSTCSRQPPSSTRPRQTLQGNHHHHHHQLQLVQLLRTCPTSPLGLDSATLPAQPSDSRPLDTSRPLPLTSSSRRRLRAPKAASAYPAARCSSAGASSPLRLLQAPHPLRRTAPPRPTGTAPARAALASASRPSLTTPRSTSSRPRRARLRSARRRLRPGWRALRPRRRREVQPSRRCRPSPRCRPSRRPSRPCRPTRRPHPPRSSSSSRLLPLLHPGPSPPSQA